MKEMCSNLICGHETHYFTPQHLLSMWNMHNAGLRAGDAKKNKIHLIGAHRTLPISLGLQGDPTNPS